MLLGNALGGLFGSSSAQAAPPAAEADNAAPAAQPAQAQPQPEDAAQSDEDDRGGFFDSLFGGGDEMNL
jgi:ribosomal protein L12E/L44/L45/RPP1/RPP2